MNNEILIIEDDVEFCEEIAPILEDEGYHVTTANDGIQGKHLLQKTRFAIVLLDLKLPCLSGFDILALRPKLYADTKVIVITGRPLSTNSLPEILGEHPEEEELLKQADAVLNKPFNISLMLSKIRYICNSQ